MRSIAGLALAGFVALFVHAAHAAQQAADVQTAGVPGPRAAQPPAAVQGPSVAEIVDRNAAARGGVEAWRKIQTMVWVGHAERANLPGHKLPFVLEQKRPRSTRFELSTDGQKSLRVFDGNNGWKLRPSSSGVPETQPYSSDELIYARGAQVIDGPLMDYAAKGATMRLTGVDSIEGRKAYRLDVSQFGALNGRIWVDAETFLELRYDRESRSMGKSGTVSMTYRDYQAFDGLHMPVVIETGNAADAVKDKLVIERIALNPPLDDRAFVKPSVAKPRRSGGIVVDTRSAAGRPGQ